MNLFDLFTNLYFILLGGAMAIFHKWFGLYTAKSQEKYFGVKYDEKTIKFTQYSFLVAGIIFVAPGLLDIKPF